MNGAHTYGQECRETHTMRRVGERDCGMDVFQNVTNERRHDCSVGDDGRIGSCVSLQDKRVCM